jgi:hypothetical protein
VTALPLVCFFRNGGTLPPRGLTSEIESYTLASALAVVILTKSSQAGKGLILCRLLRVFQGRIRNPLVASPRSDWYCVLNRFFVFAPSATPTAIAVRTRAHRGRRIG